MRSGKNVKGSKRRAKMLILTQEGIERIWELYEDPYMTDEENDVDMILRRASEWGPEGFHTKPFGAHQPKGFPGPQKGPYPFERADFINALLKAGWPDRYNLERSVMQLYHEGLIDDVQNVRARKSYPHGKLHSREHTKHWYGDTGRLSEVHEQKTSIERLAHIKSLYPERFLSYEETYGEADRAQKEAQKLQHYDATEELELLELDNEGNIVI